MFSLLKLPFLRTLIAVDLGLICIHIALGVATVIGAIDRIPPLWSISIDWAIPETFNYLKWLCIIVVLLLAYWRVSHRLLLVLGLLFAVILLDDSMQLHEWVGEWTAAQAGLTDQAPKWLHAALEAIVFVAIGVIGVLAIFLTWPTAPRELKHRLRPAAGIMLVIIFFGFFVDLLHAMMSDGLAKRIMSTVEDGGELIGISFLCAYIVRQFWAQPALDATGTVLRS